MRIPREVVVAALTVVTVAGVGHSVLPSSQSTEPAAQQRRLEQQYSSNRRRELEDMRSRAMRDGAAIDADKLRAAEHRAAGDVARDSVRRLFRRP